MMWKPISTAPKDGEGILVWDKFAQMPRPVYWSDDAGGWEDSISGWLLNDKRFEWWADVDPPVPPFIPWNLDAQQASPQKRTLQEEFNSSNSIKAYAR